MRRNELQNLIEAALGSGESVPEAITLVGDQDLPRPPIIWSALRRRRGIGATANADVGSSGGATGDKAEEPVGAVSLQIGENLAGSKGILEGPSNLCGTGAGSLEYSGYSGITAGGAAGTTQGSENTSGGTIETQGQGSARSEIAGCSGGDPDGRANTNDGPPPAKFLRVKTGTLMIRSSSTIRKYEYIGRGRGTCHRSPISNAVRLETPTRCPVCNETFDDKYETTRHIAYDHHQDKNEKGEPSYYCALCGNKYGTRDVLHGHVFRSHYFQ